MRITVAILDDNLFFVPVLEEKIRQVFEECELELSIGCFTDPAKLELDDKNYDLLFTDIMLPGQDGIMLADRLQSAAGKKKHLTELQDMTGGRLNSKGGETRIMNRIH